MIIITDEQIALTELKKIQGDMDIEYAHIKADDILCDFLNSLGYDKVVDVYNEIDKWFA